jgi:phage terminase large subunit
MIEVLTHQKQFILSSKTHTAIVGGFGSGKSYAGTLKTVIKKLKYPNIDVAYYLPTYQLIKDMAFARFTEFLTLQNVPFQLNRSDKEFITPYGKIIMRSMDNPDMIVAYEVGYSLIDEADVMPTKKMEDAFKNIVARNRKLLPNGDINQLDFVSTPEGFGFLYDFFIKRTHENKSIIKAKTTDNPFLPKDFIDTLKMSYTPQQLQAYINGEFVNLQSGNVYHHFNRIYNNTNRQIQPNDTLHIGMDFNITKMSAVIHVFEYDILSAVDEITNAYDTNQLCELIKQKYQNHKIVVYPDASGDSRKTSSDKTDHQIIKNAGFVLISGKSNPSVKDRINIVNMAFKDNQNKIKYFVNCNNCPSYAESLEQLTYKNGVPDKQSGHDHLTDGGGYCAYDFFGKVKLTYKLY